ncbi:hypothetical protein K439DRAFT_1663402 [Ramaria rubella]|nr:hypothetical protein K439DRAFT_1663402 [Ramaria rubella]
MLKCSKWLAFSVLLYVFLLHASTLYLFTRGFLLTRLSLTNISSCPTSGPACTLPPTHTRMVLLIIDALRFDFVSSNPASTPSPHYHHVLTLPSQLTAQDPTRSFIFNTYADPPTATLQRIKGIMTGSLPTFVDAGSNFGGSQIAEDSLVLQMRKAGRKIAFMGDDTWITVYPSSFVPNMTFPFDSFNVEDLHTVDEGVIANIFPLLESNKTADWDLLIGHFLGVDHVGHRLGPAHPTMAAKLHQMNVVLSRIVESLDDQTLLVVIGDHGMDRKGDHGGDGEHETSAATWIYSKSVPLSSQTFTPPPALVPNTTFPGAPVTHRSIQQIDLVPTVSLLLGLPIPFNNLGTVIPELFGREDGTLLEQALRLNANQIKGYFDAYRASPSGGELDVVWNHIGRSWASTLNNQDGKAIPALYAFTRLSLASCRSLWARFNVVLMYTGLFSIALGSAAVWALYTSLGRGTEYWEANGWAILARAYLASFLGGGFGACLWFVMPGAARFFTPFEAALLGTSLASSFIVLVSAVRKPSLSLKFPELPILLIIHSLVFLSNSFTFWEDRILTFLLVTSLAPNVFCAFKYPEAGPRLRNRVLLFSALFAICVRLAGISTVCREEQHPYCHVTFYASSTLPSPPLLVFLLSLPMSVALPYVMTRIMAISGSDKGIAQPFLAWGLRAVMCAGNAYWILEWLESSDIIGQEWAPLLRAVRTQVARSAVGATVVGGSFAWWVSPLCLEIQQSVLSDGKRQMQVVGYANSYGASFLLFVMIPFSLFFVATQLTGQITLCLSVVALLALLEVIDSARDMRLTGSEAVRRPSATQETVTFADVTPISLLALHLFYTTGHQSTMSSIQWKSAFVLTPTLVYPISPTFVVLNAFGPQLLFAAAVPLLTLWNVEPIVALATVHSEATSGKKTDNSMVAQTSANPHVLVSSLRAALGMSLYFSILLLSSAASSAWLRRHLMVWKVFAPRFMSAGIAVMVVDLGVMLGVTLGVGQVLEKVNRTFKGLT